MVGSNVRRQEWLAAFFAANKFKHVKLLPNEPCKTKEDAEHMKKQYIDEGYEGVMLRNLDASYEHKRSYPLQKFKATSDAEFKVRVTLARGVFKASLRWSACGTPDRMRHLRASPCWRRRRQRSGCPAPSLSYCA